MAKVNVLFVIAKYLNSGIMIFLLTFYGHELIINEIFMNYLMGHSWKFVLFFHWLLKT